MVCKVTNIVVRAVFDATITQKFDKSRRLYVCASDEFSRTDAENNLVPTLEYTEDTVGYFLLPEGTQNLSWGFFGESSDPEIDKNGTKTGKIQLPQQGMQYTLTLKYSKTPDGYLTVNVKVREYESAHDDSFTFSPATDADRGRIPDRKRYGILSRPGEVQNRFDQPALVAENDGRGAAVRRRGRGRSSRRNRSGGNRLQKNRRIQQFAVARRHFLRETDQRRQ